ncbi:MAG: hypothetical protein ABL909_00995 [Sphingopyxis sp.]
MKHPVFCTKITQTALTFAFLLALLSGADSALAAPQSAPAPIIAPSSYADVADFAVLSATIIDARIRRVREVEAARAIGVPAHLVRLYIEADVQAVIFGRDPVAARIAYITDQPRQANGRPPRLNRQRVLLFARRVAAANQIQLVQPGAQLLWDAGREVTARAISAEMSRAAPPPAIIGVSQAFFVAGTIAGESETQIFLSTENSQPVSLTILRRPGQAPRWAAAFGEIVDESAAVPARRTLGWYRLACGLPAALPRAAVSNSSETDARAIVRDYTIVTNAVGPCDRTPAAPIPVTTTRQ